MAKFVQSLVYKYSGSYILDTNRHNIAISQQSKGHPTQQSCEYWPVLGVANEAIPERNGVLVFHGSIVTAPAPQALTSYPPEFMEVRSGR